VRTLISEPLPPEVEQLLERRRRWGADRHDEVWAGVLHVNPAAHSRHARIQQQVMVLLDPLARAAGLTALGESNLGEPDDFRIPDGMLQRPGPDQLYLPTAALVLEVVSPDDETWEKLAFYAHRGVEELLIVDPRERTVHWLALAGGRYAPVARSGLVELGPDQLYARIDWPELDG
jgi:Uma2 family endonuclease